MGRITSAIVHVEGPVHEDEIARRVTGLFGKSRTGSLISAATLRSLRALKASSSLIEQDGFWMTRGSDAQSAGPRPRRGSNYPAES